MSGISDFFNNIFGLNKPRQMLSPYVEPTPTPTLTPKPKGYTADQIKDGLTKFGPTTPLIDSADDLATAVSKMPKGVDPLLPVVVSLMETGGGQKMTAENNPFNLRGEQYGRRKFIDYPDIKTSILGGDNRGVKSKGFTGTINEHPSYAQFRKTGNLEDFFSSYTPPGKEYGNPTMPELISRYQQLRSLFEIQQQLSNRQYISSRMENQAAKY